jgi:glutamine---fructose-6-phosphate transaminase (isomerizing)
VRSPMCGIVGYSGPLSPKDVIISGLKKLEYRGYDSAGVAILDNGKFKQVRASGKLNALEEKLMHEKFSGHVGIGHTRWATHGVPSERNAHPHKVGGVSIVHNGIIENYATIREELVKNGREILSETDSELVAHLISMEVEQTKDLYQAITNIIPSLHGAYSVLAVWEGAPDTIVAFKNGPPLILGIGEDDIVIASDVQAILSYTQKVIYLEDHEVAVVKGKTYEIFSISGAPITKKIELIEWTPQQLEKQGFPHYMLKEIYEQPRAVASAIDPHLDLSNATVKLRNLGLGSSDEESLKILSQIDRVQIVACGTSFYAGMVGEYLIERLARVPVEVDIASEFRYREPVISKNTLVVVISQSGETADTLAALRMANQMGALSLSICNVKNSTIDREAKGHMSMNAGLEIGVASTKAFVCTLSLLNLLAVGIAKAKSKIDLKTEQTIVRALLAVPSQMEAVLAYNSFFAEAASSFKAFKGFLYMARGVNFPIAMEGALKLKELAYMHAEGYAAGEMKHGPLALIDQRMAIIMVAPNDDLYDKTVSNLEEAKARGGQIISIGTGENEKLRGVSQHYLSLPEAHWTVNPLLAVIPLQLLAYHLADKMGHDVDQPRNLAKSVTVE